jgi:hypothetical protein
MREVLLLWLPLTQVLIFGIIGAALAANLGSRFPADARAALAVLLGMAATVCLSPLLLVGVPPSALGLLLVSAGGAAALYFWRESSKLLRAAVLPAALATGVIALVGTPWLVHGGWDAASFGNADTYLWVSEARSFLDGPPSRGMPDREAFEMIGSINMPIGIPTGVALAAVLGGTGPDESAGAFFVLVSAALALAAFFCARAIIGFGSLVSTGAGVLVGLNTFLVFCGYYGWHAQLLLTAFGTLAAFLLGDSLRGEAGWRERALSGIFGAAAVGTYGLLFGFFVAMAVCVLVAHVAFAPVWRTSLRPAFRVAAGCVLALFLAGFVPLTRAVIAIPELSTLTSALEDHPRGLISEALGLAPRAGELSLASSFWGGTAVVIAVLLVALAVLGGRLREFESRTVLVGAGGFALLAMIFMVLPQMSSYASVKVMGYGAPAVTLLVFTGLARTSRRRVRLWVGTAAALLFVTSSAVSIVQGHQVLQWSSDLGGLREAARAVPLREAIAIGPSEAWYQTWAAYYLRDRPTVVLAPTFYFSRFGTHTFDQTGVSPSRFVFEAEGREGTRTLWRGDGFVLHSVSPERQRSLRVARAKAS